MPAAETGETAPGETAPESPTPKKRRRIGWIITVILLSLALIATGVVLYLALQKLQEANDEIEHQRELIDEKESFASAATELMATAASLDGLPYASLVHTYRYSNLIREGWQNRWTASAVHIGANGLRAENEELKAAIDAAKEEAATNATGTVFEAKTDALGQGYLTTSLNTADVACEEDVWGCVTGVDPYTVHFDAAAMSAEPFMTDWIRTGVAYHEYAHVLQMTNDDPTEKAAEAFGGDWETMADCYALTVLSGWTLDHTIWVSDYEYWEVSVGYGYTCNASQKQVIRDWIAELGYHHKPISQ